MGTVVPVKEPPPGVVFASKIQGGSKNFDKYPTKRSANLIIGNNTNQNITRTLDYLYHARGKKNLGFLNQSG